MFFLVFVVCCFFFRKTLCFAAVVIGACFHLLRTIGSGKNIFLGPLKLFFNTFFHIVCTQHLILLLFALFLWIWLYNGKKNFFPLFFSLSQCFFWYKNTGFIAMKNKCRKKITVNLYHVKKYGNSYTIAPYCKASEII